MSESTETPINTDQTPINTDQTPINTDQTPTEQTIGIPEAEPTIETPQLDPTAQLNADLAPVADAVEVADAIANLSLGELVAWLVGKVKEHDTQIASLGKPAV